VKIGEGKSLPKTFAEEVAESAKCVLDSESKYIKESLLNTESRWRRACSIIRELGYKPKSQKQYGAEGGWRIWVSSK
jgi:hypothetical protein